MGTLRQHPLDRTVPQRELRRLPVVRRPLGHRKRAGELDPQPTNIEEAMEKAWPGSITGIHKDAKCVLRQNYEDACRELDDMRRDLDNACRRVDELEGHLDHTQGEAYQVRPGLLLGMRPATRRRGRPRPSQRQGQRKPHDNK